MTKEEIEAVVAATLKPVVDLVEEARRGIAERAAEIATMLREAGYGR